MYPEEFVLFRLDPFVNLFQQLNTSALLTRLALITLSGVERGFMSWVQEREAPVVIFRLNRISAPNNRRCNGVRP